MKPLPNRSEVEEVSAVSEVEAAEGAVAEAPEAVEPEAAAPAAEPAAELVEAEIAPETDEETVVLAEVMDADDLAIHVHGDDTDRSELKAVIEAVIYITDEPLTPQQIAAATNRPLESIRELLEELATDYARPERGLTIREIAGGYKMATKPEHHEAVRAFVKNLKPPLKLSLAALETLAVIAYKQPVTGPEIMDIRGVQGLGVLKTLIDRKLIATAGRKNVVGKPILYKTTKEFLVQFGLRDLAELPTLKEFEELGRLALSEGEPEAVSTAPEAGQVSEASEVSEAARAAAADSSAPVEESVAGESDVMPEPGPEPDTTPEPVPEPQPEPIPEPEPPPGQTPHPDEPPPMKATEEPNA